MGLGMISAMRLFDTKRREGVNMRVGIHTGTVLCGIVGTRRVKFDVWSNDVSLANRMESTGKPGQIHVSEKTFGFLEDQYVSEPGEDVEGKTKASHSNQPITKIKLLLLQVSKLIISCVVGQQDVLIICDRMI